MGGSKYWMNFPEKSITFKTSDLKNIPEVIIPEAVPVIDALILEKGKPQTLSDLKEIVRLACNFIYFTSPLKSFGVVKLGNFFNLDGIPFMLNAEAKVNLDMKEKSQVQMFELNKKNILEISDIKEKDTMDSLNERLLKNIKIAASKRGESFILGLSNSKMACYLKLKALSEQLKNPASIDGSSSDNNMEKIKTDDGHKMAALSKTQTLQKLIQLCTSRSNIPVEDIINRLKSFGILTVDQMDKLNYSIDEDVMMECKKRSHMVTTMMYPIKGRIPCQKNKSTKANRKYFNPYRRY